MRHNTVEWPGALMCVRARTLDAHRTEGSRKMNRIYLSLQHLLRYSVEGEDMLNGILIEDKSWVHHYQPNENMLQSSENIPVHLYQKV
jgi:hypothetical protein